MHSIIDAARARLDDDLWGYVAGGAETETTMRRNRVAIDSLALRPRILRDVSSVDTRTSLLGHSLRIPVVMAPIGALESLTPQGTIAAARAAERFGLMTVVSSVAEPGFEAVAAASAGPKSAQIYVRGDAAWVEALIERVVAAGYGSITLTVDLAYYGRRERQLQSGWTPPTHRDPGHDFSWQPRVTWDSLDRMRELTGLPFAIKGIQTAQDAELAVEHGVEVVWVSNHGGRQLDHGQGSIDALPEVVEAVGGRAEVVVDGGFMRGTDVLKAIALGARAVGIGRLQALALAAGGAGALVRALELIEEEIVVAMGLLGVTRLGDLDRSFLARVTALPSPSPLLAAFPRCGEDWPPPPGP
jgi:isopentenyl diphosphate isomerase/L-lactate dehydrogenase-like FMN-dependent dehydrogenase